MARPLILVVDDDEDTRRYLGALLPSWGYEVVPCGSGEEALSRLSQGSTPKVVLLDLILPGLDGLSVLDRLRQQQPGLPVIVLSTEGQLKTVVEAVKRGAFEYLKKPFSEQELELAIGSALEKQRLREEVQVLRRRLGQEGDAPEFVSSNPRLQRVKEIARQVADTDAPVLILGESGSGKEVVARFIHAQSGRRDHPFVMVNCAALPQELLESELFGYERGAFSGAIRDKPGKFEQAEKGTVLLDEIGEMSPNLQAKLLHVLQDGSYSRLGGQKTLRADARVLASTNSHLEGAVAAGRFREDLYFRLNVIRIEVPPLRERREEIPLLSAHFLRLYAARYKSGLVEFPRELMDAFLAHEWPGNVRELENAVRRYVILPELALSLEELRRGPREGEEPKPAPGAPRDGAAAAPPGSGALKGVSLKEASARAAEDVERSLVLRVLGETRWNRKEAARRLRISYKALLNKLKKWDVAEPIPPAAY